MAAYAAVISLMNNLELMQNHPHHSFSFDKEQIQYLVQYVGFFLDFLEISSHGGSKGAEALESQITSAASEADDVIESHIVDQLLAGSTLHRETSSCFLADLQKVIEDMDSVKKMVVKFQAEMGLRDQLRTYPTPAASSTPLTSAKSAMVGFDDELIHLLDVLTGQQSSLQIISVTGMGGMGKTTLAKSVNENSLIIQHFDIRMWATISQEYTTRKILSELFSCQGKSKSELDLKTEDALGEQLHKKLFGRRYLIILDDIWSIEAWDNIKVYFPDNHNGSRIVVTSRQSDVATHIGSSCLAMDFLDEGKSWNLFCEKAFAEEGCPPELEETGKMIVKKCKGLPLLIVLIGGHLGKSSREKEYWEKVGNDMISILDSGEEEQCFDILSLSYSYLPPHLKPCFLYMGIFSEDRNISVSGLVKLWVAEGFLKPNKAQSFEEVAEGCLKDLVDRNLILVGKCSRNGKIKTCIVHDLLRELCLKVATKEKFFYVLKFHDAPEPINNERRLVIHEASVEEEHNLRIIHAMESAPLTRSLLPNHDWGIKLLFDCRLLKVVSGVEGVADEIDGRFLELKLQQVNLRYLFCNLSIRSRLTADNFFLFLPSSISMLWNLQTLIIHGHSGNCVAPAQIWKMPQLRHVEVFRLNLPDPPPSDQQNDLMALQNLQTLTKVSNLRLSEDVCKRIPNIKKLHLWYHHSLGDCEATSYYSDCEATSYYSPHNLVLFQKLESLSCRFPFHWIYFLLSFAFPSSLRRLSLSDCYLQWEDLTKFGSLPHLEVLKLDGISVVGSQWNPVEGEFLRLKVLNITAYTNDLICWNAETYHFPLLEELVLEGLDKLSEVPWGIGEISTLKFIRLGYCSVSAAISAVRIVVEQESLGNEGLQLEVDFFQDGEEESFREMVQAEGLSTNNLRLNLEYD